MKIQKIVIVMAASAAFLMGAPSAKAVMPLDVDCDVLAATNDAVNLFLDSLPPDPDSDFEFANLGSLVAASILDGDIFDQLNALITVFSGGQIEFSSGAQAVSTNAKCGLIPQLIENVND